MGAGRKTHTSALGERVQQTPTVNGSVSARNLRKDKLGGVIFGCKHNTIRECLTKQMFGLPAMHFSYVRNIEPGLPLFLFNYSDRKLHGIYEAASHGQMNINPYGWTTDGSEITQFPAQVHISIRMQCQALPEELYCKIIRSNYYTSAHFWFELDRKQTNELISLFESLPISNRVAVFPYNEVTCKTSQTAIPDYDKRRGNRDSEPFGPNKYVGSSKPNMESGLPVGLSQTGPKWSDLFKENASFDKRPEDENSKLSSEADFNDLNQLDVDPCSSDASATHGLDTKKPVLMVSEADFTCLNQFHMESTSSDSAPCLDEENQILETLSDKEAVENEGERAYFEPTKQLSLDSKYVNSCTNNCVDIDVPCEVTGAFQRGKYFSETPTVLEEKYEDISVNSSGLECVLDQAIQLREEMEELKASSKEQLQKMSVLEKKLSDSDILIQQLKGRVGFLESKLDPSTISVNELLGMDKVVFVMGGYDGNSWLSALNCYSPSRDITKQLMPMACARSYASAAVVDGRIYNFGGQNGNTRDSSWYDTVECYDYWSDKWTSCPPLAQRKGCLASATVCDKIFAIGGGNGVNCFSEVEMFDPVHGRWISMQSILQKRFAPAAAELNNAIYVVGGYDGMNYLRSAERFDHREARWTRLPSMKSSRGSHSLAVLNEKLYALGGHDGNKMVASVEVFDPRHGSWMQVDDMKQSKAYFVAAVIGEAIYVIGGMKEGNTIADTVDCFKEGQGWWTTNLKGIGKRCFFSATVF